MSLAPDARAPGQARRFLAGELTSRGLASFRDVGELLLSELVTNAVVHAASEVVVELEIDNGGLLVRVRDADTGPLVGRAGAGSELDEGGRGFMLVDRLADAWGTEHSGGRKSVWFRLLHAGKSLVTQPPPAAPPSPDDPTASLSMARLMLRTLVLASPMQGMLTFSEHLGELLARVVDAVGAEGASLTLAGESSPVATRGNPEGATEQTYELVVDDRRLGQLEVAFTSPISGDEDSFLRLAADRLALLVVEHGTIRGEHGRTADNDFMSEAAELLAGSTSVALSLTLLTQIVVPRLAEWCAAFVVDERGRPRRVTVHHRREDRTDAVSDLLDADRELRGAVLATAMGEAAQRLPVTVNIGGQRNNVAILPLSSRARTLGVLVLGRSGAIDPMTFMAAVELARRASLAVENARLHEERSATVNALQTVLLPLALPDIDGVELAARYHSASPNVSVGGDFYDAVPLSDGSVVLTIGDVCGKGAEAASITGTSRDLLRMLVQDGLDLAAALRRLNRALAEHPSGSRFCTIALTRLERAGDELNIRICLAGHPEPVLLRADGTTELVGVPGDLLGVLDDDELTLTEVEVSFAVGDALVLYTDGVTERRDGVRMFGQYGVQTTLTASAGADAETLAANVERAAESFVDSELRDDLAILVIRRSS
jgi:serine phosphatase RsbU (regulator of sigma subunit)/anti-sigma regulatory factor (Ser/Thr protein kinase)